jgi:predicted TIM-barrel fold metal-dependent hydrolase
MRKRIIGVLLLLLGSFLSRQAFGQEPVIPWREDRVFQRLATILDKVPAIDMHSHLLKPGEFNPSLANVGPLQLRSTHPSLPTVIRQRFGVSAQPDNWQATIKMIDAARNKMVARLGETGYWLNHLDFTVTEIALVNQYSRRGIDGKRLLWVPHATTLLFPLPADHLMERSPSHKTGITEAQQNLKEFLKEGGLAESPADLPSYVRFVDATLRRWQQQGAVGIKFWDAYLRTLRIADVPAARATILYSKGQTAPLSRDEYLAVQDYLWRHILIEAGKINLPVHIHSSFGVPPFLRTLESDVRNLEDVLADPRFFKTQVVLIHGGAPWYEVAGYLALKPNVWIDTSAIAFLRPVPDFANILRQYLIFAPEKVLYGTDASAYPSVPGGADVHHLLVSRAARDGLYVALSSMIRDGVIDERQALDMGRGVLRENARRLHGWK